MDQDQLRLEDLLYLNLQAASVEFNHLEASISGP